MNEIEAKAITDKIIGQVFGVKNPLTLDQIMSKFAFDVNLPRKVYDTATNEETWAMATSSTKFITFKNVVQKEDWMLPKRPLNNMQDIIAAWSETNIRATERTRDSLNIARCDNVNFCENAFHCQDCGESKNLVFCDGIYKSEFVLASQRSIIQSFCIRVEDSRECSNSFSVNWSGKIADSMFIQDSYDLADCMFCSHLVSKRYCIANMQFEKEEYMKLRDDIIKWVFNS